LGDLRTFERRGTNHPKNARPNEAHRNEASAGEGRASETPPAERPQEAYHGEDRRREPRTAIDLPLTVWGVDTKGEQFLQDVRARDISLSGALLSGLDVDLASGDVIGILHAGRKARFRVVWIRYDESGDKLQAAVHRLPADACPWLSLLTEHHPAHGATETESHPSP